MSPINITMETYMQVLQKKLKINNYLWTHMWVLQWMQKKTNNYYETYMQVLHYVHFDICKP